MVAGLLGKVAQEAPAAAAALAHPAPGLFEHRRHRAHGIAPAGRKLRLHLLLHLSRRLLQHRQLQALLARVVVEEVRFLDSGRARDLVHADALQAPL